jgi:hypothetical protein
MAKLRLVFVSEYPALSEWGRSATGRTFLFLTSVREPIRIGLDLMAAGAVARLLALIQSGAVG